MHISTKVLRLVSILVPSSLYKLSTILLLKVGLGTDASGGYSPSILTVIQHASIASKLIAMQSGPPANNLIKPKFAGRQLSIATLFYLATLGGAQVCDIDNQVGSFAPGKSFDALVVNVRDDACNPGLWGMGGASSEVIKATLDAWLERFMFCGDDRNISRVYIQGKLVGGKAFSR